MLATYESPIPLGTSAIYDAFFAAYAAQNYTGGTVPSIYDGMLCCVLFRCCLCSLVGFFVTLGPLCAEFAYDATYMIAYAIKSITQQGTLV